MLTIGQVNKLDDACLSIRITRKNNPAALTGEYYPDTLGIILYYPHIKSDKEFDIIACASAY